MMSELMDCVSTLEKLMSISLVPVAQFYHELQGG